MGWYTGDENRNSRRKTTDHGAPAFVMKYLKPGKLFPKRPVLWDGLEITMKRKEEKLPHFLYF
jgi:hypothetical protein